MPIIHRSANVPQSVEQMYQLVNDIEAYPVFLPWCKESRVLSRSADEIRATLTLSGGGFQKSFTTLNRLQPAKMIEIRLLDGPFRQLEGFWHFNATPEQGCQVTLDLEFEFSNKLIGLAFGPLFNQVVNTLVEAFCARARDVYSVQNSND